VLVWSFEPVANGGDSYSRKIQMEGPSDAGQSEGLETVFSWQQQSSRKM